MASVPVDEWGLGLREWEAAVDRHKWRGYLLEWDENEKLYRLSRSWKTPGGAWKWKFRESLSPWAFVRQPGAARRDVESVWARKLPAIVTRTRAAGYHVGAEGLPLPKEVRT